MSSARALFATAGLEASVEDVTRHAGVGMGTLYRHFATKEELIDAVLEEAFEEFLHVAESALEEPDPWTGLCMFFEQAVAMHAENRGLQDVVSTRAHGLARAAAMRRQLRPRLVRLVERAQEDGSLRADFAAGDITLLLWGAHGVIECGSAVAPESWRRYLGFVLDGLRSEAATPQHHAPLTRAQLDRATRSPR